MFNNFDDPLGIAKMCIGSNKGQWWADPNFGSTLWQLKQEKITSETAGKVEKSITEAIGWLKSDGFIKDYSITVETERVRVNYLVILTYLDGSTHDITGGY